MKSQILEIPSGRESRDQPISVFILQSLLVTDLQIMKQRIENDNHKITNAEVKGSTYNIGFVIL